MSNNAWTLAVDLTGFAASGLEDFSDGVPKNKSRPTFRISGVLQTGAVMSSRSTMHDGRKGVEIKVRLLGQAQLLNRARTASAFELMNGPSVFAHCELLSVDAIKDI